MALIFAVITSTAAGRGVTEDKLLLCGVSNNTGVSVYDSISSGINKTAKASGMLPKIIHSPEMTVDSFPSDSVILKARSLDASYILWGSAVPSEYGISVRLSILKIQDVSLSHIHVVFNKEQKRGPVLETIESKLIHWSQRSSMAQLIITTKPSNAGVSLDDSDIGVTPVETMVKPGTYELVLHKDEYTTQKLPVSLISGNTYQYDLAMSKETDESGSRKTIVTFLSISAVCAGVGAIAHYQREAAYEEYQNATPPADFDRLYNRANAWNVARNAFFAGSGISLSIMVIKVWF